MKRLKRGREEQSFENAKTTDDFFSDEEEKYEKDEPAYDNRRRDDYAEDYPAATRYRRDAYDDMGDFIADEDDDLDEAIGERGKARGYEDERGRRGKSNKELMEMLPQGIGEE